MQLDDPEVCVLLNALRAAQQFLSCWPGDQRFLFFVASRGSGVPSTTKGPAGALKGYLMRIGASLDRNGFVHFHSGLTLSLFDTPFPTLRNLVRQEWMNDLSVLHSERKCFRGAPAIDRRLTIQTLASFPEFQQKPLLCEMVHAFQTHDQKAKWTGEDVAECPFCPKQDTRKHRYTNCDALQHVYQRHPPSVAELVELDDIHCDLPVIFVSPFRELLLQCHFHSVPTSFVSDTVQFVNGLLQQGITPTFFSDGSCTDSKTPSYSLAAWSLIVCKAHTDADHNIIGGLTNNLVSLPFSHWPLVVAMAIRLLTEQNWQQWWLYTNAGQTVILSLIVHMQCQRISWFMPFDIPEIW